MEDVKLCDVSPEIKMICQVSGLLKRGEESERVERNKMKKVSVLLNI